MSNDRNNTLAFLQDADGSFLMGTGPFVERASPPAKGVAFYRNDFWLSDPKPWKIPCLDRCADMAGSTGGVRSWGPLRRCCSRVSREFAPRSFRRYQTLDCIDVPERVGKRAMYGYRHFVQALLVRRLLWERVPADRIATLMAGRSTEEAKRMLFEGIEMVARQGGGELAEESGEVEIWKHVRVAPGVELHLRDDLPKLKPAEVKKLLVRLEVALRKTLR